MKHRPVFGTVFLDLILNALIGFVALFVIAYLQISPKKDADPALATLGKYVAILTWPDESNDDVDLYMEDPVGNVVYFRRRDAGLMHLERDDRGELNDTVVTEQGRTVNRGNEERIIIRGIVPGEYTVNVHMFDKVDPLPVTVSVTLLRLAGSDQYIAACERVLRMNGDERTAFRFTLHADETVSDVTELPKRFVGMLPQGP